MSSRSTSPTPSSKGGGSESGGVASLSNDALYTPLSSLHADNNHPSNNSNQTQSKKKSRHSLSLQTSASLRESSLVTFLTSMGNNLKTSHPQECHVYRGLGGSIGRYGTGDGGRVDKAMRNTMENKLSNRSLVLVGGGIHSYTPDTKSSGGDAKSGGMARSSKRIRKRVGGNGVFGCKLNLQPLLQQKSWTRKLATLWKLCIKCGSITYNKFYLHSKRRAELLLHQYH